MPQIRVTLHRKDREPVLTQVWVDPGAFSDALLDNQISISVGDGVATGAVTIPLDVLSALMAKTMAKAASQPGIAVPEKKIILPS